VTPAQIPILCVRCGGRADPEDDGGLHCPFCGASDRLPADELDRALELKRRVDAAARAAAQLDGLQATLARIFEDRRAFWRVQSTWLAAFAFVAAFTIHGVATAHYHVPIAQVLAGPVWIGGIMLAFAVALAAGRAHYRRRVRALLYARAPRVPGKPAGCRACGADLPDGRGPFLRCAYCATHNLVTRDIAADRARILSEDEAASRGRAHRVVGEVSTIRMTRVMVIAIAAVYAAQIGIVYLAQP
jgi:DNA-directed RNA polymerase subunit RPC12/RpoP